MGGRGGGGGGGMGNDDREMDDQDNERNSERDNGPRYNHEEEDEREEDERHGGGTGGPGPEHFDKEERPSKMEDEGYGGHHGGRNKPMGFNEGGDRPEHFDDEHGGGDHGDGRFYKENENDRMGESRSVPDDSRRGGDAPDWEQNERPNMPDHRNSHSRSHMHHGGMHGRYPPEQDRYHTSENDDDDDYPHLHRSLHEPSIEELPARPSHIFDHKRGSDEYNDNIGRHEHFNHHMRPGGMDLDDDRRSMDKMPCDKKKSAICDEHGESPMNHFGHFRPDYM